MIVPALIVCAAVTLGPPLNLRAVPNGPVLAWLLGGDVVTVDGNAGNWMHVQSRFGPGWAYGPYMTPVPCASPPPLVVAPPMGAVLLCNVWGCRSSPYLPPLPVPVAPVVLPAPSPAPPPALAPEPPALTQDQQREDIIRQGEEFCRTYVNDPICHRRKKE